MFKGYRGVFFLSLSVCCANQCFAQFIDDIDIPVFEETQASASTPEKKENSAKKTTPAESAIISPQTTKPEPNIGPKAIPLDKLILTPNPLPEVSIPLTDNTPPEMIPTTPQLPVNTRQESILLPPPDKTDNTPAQPSNFANLHDVRQFDLEGFYLGMSPQSVLQMAKQKNYWVVKVKKGFPLFQTSYYENQCRQSGIHAPEMVRACIYQNVHKNKQDYVKEITLSKKRTHESFHFVFTSLATGNEAYQITYQNKGDNSLNFMPTNLAKKLNRKEAFFNAVFDMYGYPDDNNQFIWGSDKDAYMQVSMSGSAYDATIKLVDVKLSNEDYFEAEDWKNDQKSPDHFGFAK